MNDLPVRWVEARLEDLLASEPAAITDGPFGSNLKTEHYTEVGPRVIRLQNIGDGVFRDERAHISSERFEALKKHEARAGDVVIAVLGEVLPRACVVPDGLGPAIVKADCIRVRLHSSINPRFIAAMLNSPEVRRAASAEISGVGRPRLNLTKIRSVLLPVPPAAEQDRIVAVIEEQFSRLDAAQTSLAAARRKISTVRRFVLAGVVPEAEKWVTTADIADVQGGIQKQPKRRPIANRFPFLRVANVGRNKLDLSEVHEVELFEGELERHRLQPGDLLVVEGNGSPGQIGRSALWRGEIADCVHQNHLIRVRPNADIDPHYFALYWNAPQTAARLREVASSTSGLYTLSTAKVKSVMVPSITLDKQREIVARTEEQLSLLDALLLAVEHADARSSSLRRSILHRASKGHLVSRDPSEKSASAVLKVIVAKSETAMKPRRRKRA